MGYLGRGLALIGALLVLLFAASSASAAPPANDAFDNAETLTPPPASGESTATGTTVEATGEAHEPNAADQARYPVGCDGAAGTHGGSNPCQRSVWYSLTPVVDGPVALQTCQNAHGTV